MEGESVCEKQVDLGVVTLRRFSSFAGRKKRNSSCTRREKKVGPESHFPKSFARRVKGQKFRFSTGHILKNHNRVRIFFHLHSDLAFESFYDTRPISIRVEVQITIFQKILARREFLDLNITFFFDRTKFPVGEGLRKSMDRMGFEVVEMVGKSGLKIFEPGKTRERGRSRHTVVLDGWVDDEISSHG